MEERIICENCKIGQLIEVDTTCSTTTGNITGTIYQCNNCDSFFVEKNNKNILEPFNYYL
jgi:RecJ-like exonuclease